MTVVNFSLFLVVLISTSFGGPSNSIDWCEYWARVGKKSERPECSGYELPVGVKRTETFSCSKTEMYNCLDCEPTCHNLVPKCRKEQCNKGCVCKNGLARNAEGRCVSFRECAAHAPPVKNDSVKGDEEEGTVMKTVKKMVPVIVNDVWKALFNSISTPDVKTSKPKNKVLLKTVSTVEPIIEGVENLQINQNFTTPPPTEIKDEKQPPQKGFYIDY